MSARNTLFAALQHSIPEPNTGCWLWERSVNSDGYGTLAINQKFWVAHRAAYVATYGEIPSGMYVCHRCDVPSCVNPDHLFLGTQRENVADMFRKGRNGHKRGAEHHSAKLTEDDIRAIRSDPRNGPEIARYYGITTTHVYGIKKRSTWKDVA